MKDQVAGAAGGSRCLTAEKVAAEGCVTACLRRYLALLGFCPAGRQAGRAPGPERNPAGLHPDNRRVRRTGRMVLLHLGELRPRIGNMTDPPTVRITRGVQFHPLELLGIEVTQTRWPQT
ncbi:hypothetical protein [Streptomyces sp. NBC_00385]|uniref:hypothetical protein n=1 Tax=Streptomyces sp. NBC_00385 TaxID=2975733 RepID=UPI002DDBB452|nr:hypothetical protein [Streptomyces sp. NBC_00385]WRZ04775.1 hypothetical protein OG959_16110 [Streptomyces sp. NBC_00385]